MANTYSPSPSGSLTTTTTTSITSTRRLSHEALMEARELLFAPKHHGTWRLSVIVAALAVLGTMAAVRSIPLLTDKPSFEGLNLRPRDRVFTESELALYHGKGPSGRIYLAVLGEVFDVTPGDRFYSAQTQSEYKVFAGRDASRAFVTGEFDKNKKDLDDVSTLSNRDLKAVDDWRVFYLEHKAYRRMGVLSTSNPQRSFYDKYGNPTPVLKEVWRRLEQQREVEAANKAQQQEYPNCNSHWAQNKGGKLWCDGDKVPRIGTLSSDMGERCACYDPAFAAQKTDVLRVPNDCDPRATTCPVPP